MIILNKVNRVVVKKALPANNNIVTSPVLDALLTGLILSLGVHGNIH